MVKCLIKDMHHELHCAHEYAAKALHYKSENKTVADAFYALATARLNEVKTMHSLVVNAIATADSTQMPAVMQAIWDFEKDLIAEQEAEARMLLTQYGG